MSDSLPDLTRRPSMVTLILWYGPEEDRRGQVYNFNASNVQIETHHVKNEATRIWFEGTAPRLISKTYFVREEDPK